MLLWHIPCRNCWCALSCSLTRPSKVFCLSFNVVSDGLDLRPKYTGLFHCMKSVWAQEGLRGLYQGVTPNVWGAGASWGLYFLLYVSYNHFGICLRPDISHRLFRPVTHALFPRALPSQLQCNQRVHEGGPSNWAECHRAPGVGSRGRLVPLPPCRDNHTTSTQLSTTTNR